MSVQIFSLDDLRNNDEVFKKIKDEDPSITLPVVSDDVIVLYFDGMRKLQSVVSALILNASKGIAEVVISDIGIKSFRDNMLKHIIEYVKCYAINHDLKSIVLNLYTRSIRDEYSRLWYWYQFSPDIFVWHGPTSVDNTDLGQSFIDPNKLFNFGRLKFTTTITVS